MNAVRVWTLSVVMALSWAGPGATAAGASPVTARAAVDVASVAPRQKAPNDRSEYRRFVLPNGMKVLLLSDPKMNVSAASVAVGVGSLADPPSRPGLAHYLEHMLFLGTEKYPAVDDFDQYLRSNGGFNNAYTAPDRTNYHLEIPPKAFDGALDRFAQFFIAPKFTPEFNEREVNAVNSEYQKNLENDAWREYMLRKSVLREGHPARGFSIGNRDTLAGTTQEELRDFHRRHYSANRMTLALTGPQSLDELERMARTHFAAVPDLQRPELRYPADVLPPKPALRMLRMEPLVDARHLSLAFPLPDLSAHVLGKPAALVAVVLGNEGAGSLLAVLKREGLATSLSAGADAESPDYGWFEMKIGLTPAGLERVERVLALVFAAVDRLRRDSVPPHLFAERARLAELAERYRDLGEGAARATGLANALMDHPIEIAERAPFLWVKPDPAGVKRVLDALRPDNLLATLVAKGVPTDRTEARFGARYGYTETGGDAYAALLQPPRVDGLRPMPPNPFVPQSTALRAIAPTRIVDEPTLVVHHLQDTEFERPLVAHMMAFRLPRAMATRDNAALMALYGACINEALNERSYAALEAGLHFKLTASLEGVVLAVDGWDASAGKLLDLLAGGMKDCTLPADRFAAVKDLLVRQLSSFERADAYVTVTESRRRLVREFHWRPDELLPVVRRLQQADVQRFARGLFSRGKLEVMSVGNLTPADAEDAARRVARRLGAAPVDEAQLLRRRLVVMDPGESLFAVEKLVVNNSAYRRELMLGPAGTGDTPELRAAALALSAFIGTPTYTELRTRQQLGYIVFGGAGEEGPTEFAYFIVQSGEHDADELRRRTDAFVGTLPAMLRALPAEAWSSIVAGVRAKLTEADKSVAERALRLFDLAYEHQGDWARREATLAALDGLGVARAAEILAAAFDPSRARSRSFLGFARQHAIPAGLPTNVADPAAWKARQRYR